MFHTYLFAVVGGGGRAQRSGVLGKGPQHVKHALTRSARLPEGICSHRRKWKWSFYVFVCMRSRDTEDFLLPGMSDSEADFRWDEKPGKSPVSLIPELFASATINMIN